MATVKKIDLPVDTNTEKGVLGIGEKGNISYRKSL